MMDTPKEGSIFSLYDRCPRRTSMPVIWVTTRMAASTNGFTCLALIFTIAALLCRGLMNGLLGGREDALLCEGLHHKIAHTEGDRVQEHLLLPQGCDHHDPGVGVGGENLARGLQAVLDLHRDVHGHQIRLQLSVLCDSLSPVHRITHDLETVGRQRVLHDSAHEVRIVDDQNLFSHIYSPVLCTWGSLPSPLFQSVTNGDLRMYFPFSISSSMNWATVARETFRPDFLPKEPTWYCPG